MEAISIRSMREGDTSFVYDTWLNSYRHSYFARKIRKDIFFRWHRAVITRILSRSGSAVAIACDETDPDTIYGWLLTEKQPDDSRVIHFVFVKKEFQRMGIARTLFQSAGIPLDGSFFTHWTYDANDLIAKNGGLLYDPYRI